MGGVYNYEARVIAFVEYIGLLNCVSYISDRVVTFAHVAESCSQLICSASGCPWSWAGGGVACQT